MTRSSRAQAYRLTHCPAFTAAAQVSLLDFEAMQVRLRRSHRRGSWLLLAAARHVVARAVRVGAHYQRRGTRRAGQHTLCAAARRRAVVARPVASLVSLPTTTPQQQQQHSLVRLVCIICIYSL